MQITTEYSIGEEVWWFGKYKSKIEAIFTVTRSGGTYEYYRITNNPCNIEIENLYREKQEIPYLLNSYEKEYPCLT